MTNLEIGKHLSSSYSMSIPYPHIILDNLLPEDLAKQCYNDMTKFGSWESDEMLGYPEAYRDSQYKKWYTPWEGQPLEELQNGMPVIWKCLQYFNSPPFVKFLTELTGIEGLMADPQFNGGGCHKIASGGRLEVHSDYDKHAHTGYYRRINLLLYLTPNWQEEWGGNLELWTLNPFNKVKSISPIFNRAVIFNTTVDALHGHPIPLNTPEGVHRYSLALYYFTKDRPEHEKSNTTSAMWYKTNG